MLVRFVRRSFEPGIGVEVLPDIGIVVGVRESFYEEEIDENKMLRFPIVYDVLWPPFDGDSYLLVRVCFEDQITQGFDNDVE